MHVENSTEENDEWYVVRKKSTQDYYSLRQTSKCPRWTNIFDNAVRFNKELATLTIQGLAMTESTEDLEIIPV